MATAPRESSQLLLRSRVLPCRPGESLWERQVVTTASETAHREKAAAGLMANSPAGQARPGQPARSGCCSARAAAAQINQKSAEQLEQHPEVKGRLSNGGQGSVTLSIQVSDADRERKEPTVNTDKFQSKMGFSDGFYMK